PGQHLSIVLPRADGGTTTRNYSLVGPARIQDRKSYQIAVRHQTGVDANGQPWQGEVSRYVHEQLSVGDTVHIGCPKGPFVMPENIDQPVVLIAGGIGITPFLSYLESLA